MEKAMQSEIARFELVGSCSRIRVSGPLRGFLWMALVISLSCVRGEGPPFSAGVLSR